MVILHLMKTKTKLGCPPRRHVIGREIYKGFYPMVEGIHIYKHIERYEQEKFEEELPFDACSVARPPHA